MGADIYLQSKSDAQKQLWEPRFHAAVRKRDAALNGSVKHAEYQAEVETAYDAMYSVGYFRDSYNPSNLLSKLGLSWSRDVGPMLNDDNYLSLSGARQLRMWVAQNPINERAVRESVCEGEETFEECMEYFEHKRKQLLALLDESIRLGEPLYMSI